MALQRNTGLKRSSLKKGGLIKKRGSRTIAWEQCRKEMIAEAPRNEDDLIRCQCYQVGLPDCGWWKDEALLDLHHLKGRDGNLLTDKRYLVFLTRECHDAIHALRPSTAKKE